MNRVAKWLLLIGLVMGLASALFLYWGSVPVPWDLQTMDGSSLEEKAFRLARQKESTIGLILLFGAFLFQIFGSFEGNIKNIWQRIIQTKKSKPIPGDRGAHNISLK